MMDNPVIGSEYQNRNSRPFSGHLALIGLVAVLSIFAAYQLRLREELANAEDWKFSGFHDVESEGEHKFRWTNGNGEIIFPDVGRVAQVRLKIKARAWRTETFVYSATVTVNGLPVGIIDRAGWRDWLIVISDPTVLGADRLVIGFKSTPFRYSELFPDSGDDRELGVSVESVQIEPQSSTEPGLLNHLTLPPTNRIAFGIILGVATYLFSCCLGARPRSALYHSLIAIVSFAILLTFYGLVAIPPILILVGVAGFVSLARVFSVSPTTVAAVSIPFFLFALLANAYLGFFSRYFFDDFCNAGYVVRQGMIGYLYHYFFFNEGRYSLLFTLGIVNLVGPRIVPLLPLSALTLWLAVTIWTIFQLRKFINLDYSISVPFLFASMVLCGTVAAAPNIVEPLFWETGMLTYLFPLAFLTFLVGFIMHAAIRESKSSSPFLLVACAGLGLFAVGFNETFAVLQIATFSLAVALCMMVDSLPGKRTLLSLLIASLAGSILGMTIMILSPGSAARQAAMINLGLSPAERPGWLSVIGLSIQHAVVFAKESLFGSPFLPVVFLLATFVSLLVASDRRKVIHHRSFKRLATALGVPLVLGFLLVAVSFAPSVYTTSSPPPPRALIDPLFVIVCTVTLEGYLFGLDGRVAAVLHRVGKLSSFNALLILAILIVAGPVSFSRSTLDKVPSWSAFAQAWEKRDVEIRSAKEAGSRNVEVLQFENPYGHDIGANPISSLNACTAIYYGLDSIVGK
jgi:hypothetical protein